MDIPDSMLPFKQQHTTTDVLTFLSSKDQRQAGWSKMTPMPAIEKQAAYKARSHRLLSRILAAKEKGEETRDAAEERTRIQERKVQEKAARREKQHEVSEIEAQGRRSRQQSARRQAEQQRAEMKQRAVHYLEAKKALQADEKARKQFIGGMSWGFDPLAGMLSSTTASTGGAYKAGRNVDHQQGAAADRFGHINPVQRQKDNTWGIEKGGPGNEGKYTKGSVQDQRKLSAAADAPVASEDRRVAS